MLVKDKKQKLKKSCLKNKKNKRQLRLLLPSTLDLQLNREMSEQQKEEALSDPLYRTKLMVVGFENVGKTTVSIGRMGGKPVFDKEDQILVEIARKVSVQI